MTCETVNQPKAPLFDVLRQWIRSRAARRAQKLEQKTARAAFRNLADLDDNMLKDIGVTRNDVNWASQLPLSQNAAQELHRISLQNRTRF